MLRNMHRLLASRPSWSDPRQFIQGTISDLIWWTEALSSWNAQSAGDRRPDVDRCFRVTLGSSVFRRDSSWVVEPLVVACAMLLPGNDGSASRPKIIQNNALWQKGPSNVRQCLNSSIHKPWLCPYGSYLHGRFRATDVSYLQSITRHLVLTGMRLMSSLCSFNPFRPLLMNHPMCFRIILRSI